MSSTILVVEPEEEHRKFLDKSLSMWGYQVEACEGGDQALEAIKAGGKDLILSNIMLSDTPAIQLLQTCKEDQGYESIPFFIYAEDAPEEARIICTSNGADDFFQKDIQPVDLSMKIQNALEMLEYRREIINLTQKLEKDKKIMRRYFSKDFIEKILNEEISPELGGSILEGTIMFFDIRKSTTIAETIGANEYATFMSALLAEIMEYIFDNQGSVNEIMGDGILATFGCPIASDNNSGNAIKAAIEIREYMDRYNRDKLPECLEEPLSIGIGIGSGTIFAGNIGSDSHMKYAVMGPAVNLAARLQEMTKEIKKDIVIDGASADGNESFSLNAEGDREVRGVPQPVSIFTV